MRNGITGGRATAESGGGINMRSNPRFPPTKYGPSVEMLGMGLLVVTFIAGLIIGVLLYR